jgi:hypothetical protein
MDPNTSGLGGQRIHDSTAQFSPWLRVEISLGIAALAKPEKIYSVGNIRAPRSFYGFVAVADLERYRSCNNTCRGLLSKRWSTRVRI